jgi:hypothetical protein
VEPNQNQSVICHFDTLGVIMNQNDRIKLAAEIAAKFIAKE